MGIFSGLSQDQCPAEPANATLRSEPIAGSLTFQHLITIISSACLGASILLWLGLAIAHLRRYRAPNEQRQIFRVISTPVVFAIVAVISVNAYSAAEYVAPVANLYEALALASIFLLYVHYVAPEVQMREEFFQGLENRSRSGEILPGGSLGWFRVC